MNAPFAAPRRGPTAALLRFALRDLRGGLAGLRIVVLCVALGVAAIAGVNSLARSLEAGLARDGRTILGGDASFSLMHRELAPDERAYLSSRGAVSTVATFRAMARNASGDATLVEAKAVGDSWPDLGAAVFNPAMTPAQALAPDGDAFGAAVEPALMDRLGLSIGDRFDVGAAHFVVRARLVAEPDRLATGIGFGPRVLMSEAALRASGLVQPGALIRWTTRVRLGARDAPPPDGAAVDAFVDAAKAAFPQAGWEARSRANVAPDFARDLDRFGEFLTLVGLVALVVGGVGVANAAQSFVERKLATLAILKALGTSGGAAVALALAEFLAVTLIGIAAGLAIGAAAPFVVNALFAAALPLPLAPAIFPRELALGALYGLLTALAFAVAPLGRAHDAPVAQLFRSLVEPAPTPPRWRYRLAAGFAALALAALATLAAPQRSVALVVVVASAAAMVGLRLVAAAAMALARRAPRPASVVWRLALANLSRKGALTPSVALSLGLGVAAVVALTLVDSNLRAQLRRTPGETPSFYFLDVGSGEVDAFRRFLADQAPGATIVEAPMMRGRIVRIGDTPAAEVKAKESAAWALEGDRGVTFAATPPDGSKVVAGQWWSADYGGPPLVSMEAGVADGLGVKIGDMVTLNVLGREVTARVANLRRVDWRSFAINFIFVFSPDTFRGAPYTGLFTAALPPGADGPAAESALTKAAARDFPSVAAIRVREALATIEALTAKLALAIRAASGVALMSAALVLAGALAASRRARIADAVILKILGATRQRLIAAFLAEYALLGAFSALFGAAAGVAAAYAIVVGVMGFDFAFAAGPAAAAVAAGLALTVGPGMVGAWRILGEKPAAFLREL